VFQERWRWPGKKLTMAVELEEKNDFHLGFSVYPLDLDAIGSAGNF
jgi:hypothetical protein